MTDSIVKQIKEILNKNVTPIIKQDGGDIVFHSFEDGIVFVELKGACAGCPGAAMTLKSCVENLLRQHIPEVKEVRNIDTVTLVKSSLK
ncbi:MAG: NifU family protein [Alphaproteobacteria bacterium]